MTVKISYLVLLIGCIAFGCHDPESSAPDICEVNCDQGLVGRGDAIPFDDATTRDSTMAVPDATGTGGTAGNNGSGGVGGMGGTGNPPNMECSSLMNVHECQATAGCWFAAAGCAEPGTVPALPENLSGCRSRTDLCAGDNCPDGLECGVFVTNPCIGQDCEACGEQTGICVPSDEIPVRCGMPGPDGAPNRQAEG